MLIRLVYTLLMALASPILLFGLYKSKPNKPKFGSRWKEHFGITPKLNTEHQPIWIHAVSVGESIAATPLIKALKAKHPEQPIVITTTTSTGAEQIAKLGDLVEHRYMPIDFGFAVKGFLQAIRPTQMLIIETELWPNTLHAVHQAGIPITVVNARLSEKSCQNYSKVQPLFNQIEQCVTKILCQFESDKDRFAKLGVSQQKLRTTGSIKFDIRIPKEVEEQGKALREQLGQTRPVWIAASTHKGEDEHVLAAHQTILQKHQDALLILVPRHPERFDDVFQLAKASGLSVIRRTDKQDLTLRSPSAQVYLGDTMGEMLVLMGASDVCFMGGSLIGDKVGGHNMLEPVALGLPVITGPSYFNFTEIVESMLEHKLICVTDQQNLADKVLTCMSAQQPSSKAFLSTYLNSIERSIHEIDN